MRRRCVAVVGRAALSIGAATEAKAGGMPCTRSRYLDQALALWARSADSTSSKWIEIIGGLLAPLTQDEDRQLYRSTAQRFYRMDAPLHYRANLPRHKFCPTKAQVFGKAFLPRCHCDNPFQNFCTLCCKANAIYDIAAVDIHILTPAGVHFGIGGQFDARTGLIP